MKFLSLFVIFLSALVGLGFLYLPYLLRQAGAVNFLLALLLAYLCMLLYADAESRRKGLSKLFQILFHYALLIGYIIAAGEQLSYLMSKNLASLLFFLSFTLIYLYFSFDLEKLSLVGGSFLFLSLLAVSAYLAPHVKPIMLGASRAFGIKAFLFATLAFFAHPLLELFTKDARRVFKIAILATFLGSLLYSFLVALSFTELSPLSTLTIARSCKGLISFLVSFSAILAFATSYMSVVSNLNDFFKEYTRKPYVFSLFIPASLALLAIWLNLSSYQVVSYLVLPMLSLAIASHSLQEFGETKNLLFLGLAFLYALAFFVSLVI